ncbi:MAG: hypothetical protein K9W45_03215 [Candidatus Heimdallarchaeum aukensis]|uniref:Uncharacterized protein n=1 Tax=Candidatus Heimdallarchaeum aukensis TaxID=2876573 RepID=A0A9Y1BMK1_9ARCH|nr:MAG: hypothetical protein K9W45_03215 [Candidatus Heimdallarchaeum aukensis]
MSNSSFNFFVIILGFLLLGLPIILIHYSTVPPTPEQFYSEINIIDTVQDGRSAMILNETAKINGSSSYWDSLGALPELSYINNITELIIGEEDFLATVNTQNYGGFKDNVHIFNLTMRISLWDNNTDTFYTEYNETLNGSSTFMFVKLDIETDAYSTFATGQYPSIGNIIDEIDSRGIQLKYIITVTFNANLEREDGNYKISFGRVILIDNNEYPILFLSNEDAWSPVKGS